MPPTKAEQIFGSPNTGVRVRITSMRHAADPQQRSMNYVVYGQTMDDVAATVRDALGAAFGSESEDEPVRGTATISPRRPRVRRARS